jgi:hypothetical protein
MEKTKIVLLGTPPRMIPTLLRGFNTIANNVYVIVIPIVLDLVLWLGPKLRLKTLLTPVVTDFTANMTKISPPDLLETIKTSQTLWEQLLNQFNLFTAVRTFPVGVPSIIARLSPISSPLGEKWIFEASNLQAAVAIFGALLTVGFLLGSLYFNFLSQVTDGEKTKFTLKQFFTSYVQSVIMFCLLLGLAIVIAIPTFLLLSILSLVNMGVGQFFVLVAAFILLWLIMPLVFSPHGVFVLKKQAFSSMVFSIRMVRSFLPGTGLFVMSSILISEALNRLWMMPDANSWLMLFGIGGHAFVISGLLAASFIYYREGLKWMQENIERISKAAEAQTENGGKSLE